MENFKQHEFNAEWVDDKHGPAIMLTQSDDGYCEPQTILVHPWQFRAVCEHFNILPTGDDQARRTITTLTRRLLTLADRIASLQGLVAMSREHEPAALVAQAAMLDTVAELAAEWARELQDLESMAAGSSDALSPATDGAQEPPNEGARGKGAASRKKRSEPQAALL